jgi:hypothetical protein
MFHYETIDTPTLELLKKLQAVKTFDQLRLVGGTSLALQIGHRKSIDIDLFGTVLIDEYSISETLAKIGEATLIKKTPNIFIYQVDGIKVDIVNYPYAWLEKIISKDNLRLAGIKDIGAMKLSAITGRGTKKDFIDLYFLLQKFTLDELISFYNKKYHDGSEFLVLRSLTYFEDAGRDEDPVMLNQLDWQEVKRLINSKTEEYISRN